MVWAIYLTLSVLSGVAATLYHRRVLHNGEHAELGYAVSSGLMAAGMITVLALVRGFDTRWELFSWWNVALGVVLWAAADMLLNLSMRVTESSLFSVLFTTRVFWGIVAAMIFLGEDMSVPAVIGTVLIAASVIMVLYQKSFTWASRPAILTLATSFFFGMGLTNDGLIVRDGYDVASYYIFAFLLPSLFIATISPEARQSAAKIFRSKKERPQVAVLAFLHGTSGLTLFYAFQEGQDLTILQSLNQTQTILVVLGALIFLHERKDIAKRIAAAVISFIGVLLIVLN